MFLVFVRPAHLNGIGWRDDAGSEDSTIMKKFLLQFPAKQAQVIRHATHIAHFNIPGVVTVFLVGLTHKQYWASEKLRAYACAGETAGCFVEWLIHGSGAGLDVELKAFLVTYTLPSLDAVVLY
jgi:hypothetical protein